MSDAPAVSVIVSVYNGADHLAHCLAALAAQTLREIEIICVDDGSTDATPQILTAASARDPRLRVIRHAHNLGLGASRNTAIAAARAPYLGAVDADDTCAPQMFEALLAGTEKGRFDVVACGFARVDAQGLTLSRGMEHRARYEALGPADDIFTLVNSAFWNKLWRRELFTETGIRFPDHLLYEDAAVTPLVMHHARNLNLIGGTPYRYVQRPGSIIRSFSARHVVDYLHVLDLVKEGLIAREAYSPRKAAFDRFVLSQFDFLARNIAGNPGMDIAEKVTLARRIRLIGEAYIAHDDSLRGAVP